MHTIVINIIIVITVIITVNIIIDFIVIGGICLNCGILNR